MATNESHDLELLLRSHIPLIAVETQEEQRVREMFQRLIPRLGRPLFQWSITDGVRRLDIEGPANKGTEDPGEFLRHVRDSQQAGIYLLADFHPYVTDPVNVRLLKEIAQTYAQTPRTLALISHRFEHPPELRKFFARYEPALPGRDDLYKIVNDEALEWARGNGGKRVRTDRASLDRLVQNLSGLTAWDARRLARSAIQRDGAITESDLPEVMAAKHQLLDRSGALSFTYDTAKFSDVGGLNRLRAWLERRRRAFVEPDPHLDPPKGLLLVGVQGGGKSLAAKAVAGLWGLPLLGLDMGTLYNKYYGESERNLREALRAAEVMAPCVLWIDEIEKAMSQSDNDGGVSQRMLGTVLTWMAENSKRVFIVATANAIERLPPELVRKGRMDEIFFVDLPSPAVRRDIFEIHLRKRDIEPEQFDLQQLAEASEGFSGAEIEQAVVAALYLAREQEQPLATEHVLTEIRETRPLSTVMREPLERLRAWARDRTVPAD
ncbi:MAG: AAA family ATPase [Ectothiorhodospiraceae bacterium]|nr:AAA family ATPase [Ectothiorhodospiraceae bacterium]MCH8503644.1 AAA family ATPase [Ectothiorhodospiraceae bacterium]